MDRPETHRISLTEVFKRVARGELRWSKDEFVSAMNKLSEQLPDAKVEWDDGAGEEWGRIVGPVVGAYVLRRAPVVLIPETWTKTAASVVGSVGIVVGVENFDEEAFEVDEQVLGAAFGVTELPDEVNYRSLSAADLWWATV